MCKDTFWNRHRVTLKWSIFKNFFYHFSLPWLTNNFFSFHLFRLLLKLCILHCLPLQGWVICAYSRKLSLPNFNPKWASGISLITSENESFKHLMRKLWCSGMGHTTDVYCNYEWLSFRTKRAMGGGIPFRTALRERLSIINVSEGKVRIIMLV